MIPKASKYLSAALLVVDNFTGTYILIVDGDDTDKSVALKTMWDFFRLMDCSIYRDREFSFEVSRGEGEKGATITCMDSDSLVRRGIKAQDVVIIIS